MKEETLRLSRKGELFLLPFYQRSSAKGRVLQPVAAAGCFAVYTGAFGPAPADGCAPLIVLRGLASQPGDIFQSLAHIGPAVPAKVPAFVQHGTCHLVAKAPGVIRQLCLTARRKRADVRFVLRKNNRMFARRRRPSGC